jgi:hypothetical protein
MIIRKINGTDIEKLFKIARSGVTSSEFEDVKAILDLNLDEKDMNKLYDILTRNKNLLPKGKAEGIISSCLGQFD